jgi:hypothetical protein
MTTKEFLTENKQEVINFYNEKVANLFDISLKDFMIDLLTNFKKITIGEDLKKFDLFGNLEDAKSRLGCFSNQSKATYSTPYAQSTHAKLVEMHGKEKANMLINAR